MKNRSTLLLTEIILMVFVFCIASALCVNAFVKSDTLAQKSEMRDRARIEMQNAIEALKCGENGYFGTESIDFSPGSELSVKHDGEDFYIKVIFTESGYGDLWAADIIAFDIYDASIVKLTAAGRIVGEADE